MSRRFATVLLDCGGTIFRDATAGPHSREAVWEGRFRRAAAAAVGLGWNGNAGKFERLLARLEPALAKRLGAGYGFDKLLAAAARQATPSLPLADAMICADAFAGPRHRAWLFPRTASNLARLRAAGVTLGVVANTPWPGWIMQRALAGVGLLAMLDTVVCSCDVGVAKPSRGIFEQAMRQMGNRAGRRICFVGDSLECDVAGARAMGWPAAFRRSSRKSSLGQAAFEFDLWEELVDWVLGR